MSSRSRALLATVAVWAGMGLALPGAGAVPFQAGAAAAPVAAERGAPTGQDAPHIQVDREAGSISFPATVQAEAFLASLPPDHQYHAVVHDGGGAADRSLFVTPASDSAVARLLRELGAEDGGGVPMAAWNLRWVPLVPQPATLVQGSPVRVTVHWEDAPREYELSELLKEDGKRGIEMRFGGNEEHDGHWDTGCILCLFSCPGGVVSNGAASIRDHQRGATAYAPSDLLPADGTEVVITLTLVRE